MTIPEEQAAECAQNCGLTLGTDQANAVITGYELGFTAGAAHERARAEGLIAALERIAAQEIVSDVGRFGRITDAAAVLDAREALEKWRDK